MTFPVEYSINVGVIRSGDTLRKGAMTIGKGPAIDGESCLLPGIHYAPGKCYRARVTFS